MNRRRALLFVVATAALCGCNGVLGLDAPELDPCASNPSASACGADGSLADVTLAEAAPDARIDAGIDAAMDDAADAGAIVDAAPDRAPPTGIRCGGGSFNETTCTGAQPTCCENATGDGGATFDCRTDGGACAYPITCSSYNDCAGSNVCCHSSTAIKCVAQSACADTELVCEPNGPTDQCPAGWKCTVLFTNQGVISPYYGCMP
jgi:hypothetical protein